MSLNSRSVLQNLGEIEEVLCSHSSVSQAAVVLQQERLVAYVAARANMVLDVTELRASLKHRLPDYKVPSAIKVLDALPRMSNGEIDREALRVQQDLPGVGAYVAPSGEVETALALIWAEILQVEQVGRHDNVFELGGYSLQAIKLVTAVNEHFGCELRLRDVFDYPDFLSMVTQLSKTSARSNLTTSER